MHNKLSFKNYRIVLFKKSAYQIINCHQQGIQDLPFNIVIVVDGISHVRLQSV